MVSNNSDVQRPGIHLGGLWEQYDIVDRFLTCESLQNQPALVDIVLCIDQFVAILFDNMPLLGQPKTCRKE